MARLSDKYREEIVPAMMAEFDYPNALAVPRLRKIVVSMGVGQAHAAPKTMESAIQDLTTVTGQRAVMTRAKKSVSNFRVREGYPSGCMVTLRRKRMYEFMDRLVSVVIPRIRDFRGLKTSSFDRAGNFSMGLGDQIVFPEIQVDKVDHTQGMNITFTIGNSNPAASLALLRRFGMPFKHD